MWGCDMLFVFFLGGICYDVALSEVSTSLIRRLDSCDGLEKAKVIDLLSQCGGYAKAAVPRLVSELGGDYFVECRRTLTKLGSIGVPYMADSLSTSKPFLRKELISIMRSIGPKAKDGADQIRPFLLNEDEELGVESAHALISICKDKEATKIALALLTNKREDIVIKAAQALVELPGDARSCLPTILRILKDDKTSDDVGKFLECWLIMWQVARKDDQIENDIRNLIKHYRKSGLNENANTIPLAILVKCDPKTVKDRSALCELIPHLRILLSEKNPRLALFSAKTLSTLGPAARECLEDLRELSLSSDETFRLAAKEAIKKVK
jgi:hypothetical protein